jgi:hypothetical protein
VWDGVYDPDFDEPLLRETWDDARAAALWNLLDPSLGAALVGYFRQHVLGGEARVHSPALRLGESARLTLGTRAALGPTSISRFLDVQAAGPWGVADVYARQLDSSVDTSFGYGAALHRLPLGPLALSVSADTWDEPLSAEDPAADTRSRWNATLELELRRGRWGGALKVGDKSEGFFPGTPRDSGVYAGAGVVAVW